MQRIVFAALLVLVVASCGYRPVFIDRPAVQPGIGSVPPRIDQMKKTGQSLTFCREVSRSRCDVQTCKGRGFDLVTFNCGATKVARCEIGKGGC